MHNPSRTNQELLEENTLLKQRIQELELSDSERKQAEEAREKRLVALTRPLEDSAGIALEELFNLDDIQLLQDEFARATGVASIITLPDGTPITAPSSFCRLCSDIIRKTEKGCANCYKSDAVIGRLYLQGPTIQPCMSGGLWDAGAGIAVGGRHIANWLIGQVRDSTQTEEKMRAYAREIGADEASVVEAFREVPAMSREQFERVAQVLFTLANQLSATAYQNVQQARFITEHKQTEEALREKSLLNQTLLDAFPCVALLLRPQTREIIASNAAAIKVGAFPGTHCFSTWGQRQEPCPWCLAPVVWDTGKAQHLEAEALGIVWDAHWIPVTEDLYMHFAFDITERKRTEEQLRESEEKYRNILENIEDGYFEVDLAGNFTFFNSSHCRIFGYPREEIQGVNYRVFIDAENAKKVFRTFNEVYVTGIPRKGFEWETIRKDGARTYIEVSVSLIARPGEKPTGFRGIARNVTERKRAEEQLRESLEQLRRAMQTTIQVLVMAVEIKDPYTAGHQRRMTNLARTMATEMGLPPEKIEGLRMAGVIHDIGKITLPTEILSKPTKLSAIELSLIREHVRLGYDILKDVESPWPLAEIVLQHHERMDGSGYPRALKGEEILIEARILAVDDVVEAMASHRPYRPALGLEAALIEKNRGLLYDSHAVDTCLRVFREKGYQIEGT